MAIDEEVPTCVSSARLPAGHDAAVVGHEHGGVQLHPRPGRGVLSRRQRPAAEHLGLLRPRPHLRLQLRFRCGRLPDAR